MLWEGSRGPMWVEAVEHMCSEHRRGNVESGKDKTEMNWETGEEKEDRGGWSHQEEDQCSYQTRSSGQLPPATV